MLKSPATERMWRQFCEASGVDGDYEAWPFGEAKAVEAGDERQVELADQLAKLVLDGPKRATASIYADFSGEADDPLPQIGGYSVILDGSLQPVCIIRTTRLEVRRFGDVDEAFAWTEGEGDRTLAWWRQGHINYFRSVEVEITDDTEMLLETFELVWPSDE